MTEPTPNTPPQTPTTPAAPTDGQAAPAATPPADPATPAQPAAPNGEQPKVTPPAGDPPAGGADLLDSGASADDKGGQSGDLLSDDGATGGQDVPDKYVFTPPDGFEMTEAMTAEVEVLSEQAREIGLNQDQFQALMQREIDLAEAATQATIDRFDTEVNGWRESARTDKEIGGPKFEQSIRHSKAALDKFGDAELKNLLASPSEKNKDGTAIGNHPAVLRLLARVGAALGDPDLVDTDTTPPPNEQDSLRRMYPSMFKE